MARVFDVTGTLDGSRASAALLFWGGFKEKLN